MGNVMYMRKGEIQTAPVVPGIAASELAVGSSVYLNENGSPVEYLVVNQGIPSDSSLYDSSCDGTWLLRKDIYEKHQWHSSNVNDYENSDVHAYLNSTFYDMFDVSVQAAVKMVKLPYRAGSGTSMTVTSGSSGLSAQIFLLSGYEVGWTTSDTDYLPIDGAALSFFSGNGDSNSNRVAYLDGTATYWWLRTPCTYSATEAWCVNVQGHYANLVYCYNLNGVRPALILPSTALFDEDTLLFKGV